MLGLWKRPGVKFCPKCKSSNIEVKYLDMFGLQPKYRCRKCGFTSFILPEMRQKARKEEN